jgi:hypothetical protein
MLKCCWSAECISATGLLIHFQWSMLVYISRWECCWNWPGTCWLLNCWNIHMLVFDWTVLNVNMLTVDLLAEMSTCLAVAWTGLTVHL